MAQRLAGNDGQPAEQHVELVERDVVEERVAAVEEPGDAAGLDVRGDALGGIEIEAAPRVRLRGSGGTAKIAARSAGVIGDVGVTRTSSSQLSASSLASTVLRSRFGFGFGVLEVRGGVTRAAPVSARAP